MGQSESFESFDVDPDIKQCMYDRFNMDKKDRLDMTPDSLFTLIINYFRKGEYGLLYLMLTEINHYETLKDVDVVCRKPGCGGKMYKTEEARDVGICGVCEKNLISINKDKLSQGSYGFVYTDIVFVNDRNEKNKNCVLKICKETCVSEMFTGLLLYCIYAKKDLKPFPEIFLLFKDEEDNFSGKKGVSCIAEKLDMELHDYILDNINEPLKFIPILIQICELIKDLQDYVGFVHGDFHTGNIMLKSERGKFRPVIIDVGSSRLDLSNIGIKNMILVNQSGPRVPHGYNDLKFLFRKIQETYSKPPSIKNFFTEHLSTIEDYDPEKVKQGLEQLMEQQSASLKSKRKSTIPPKKSKQGVEQLMVQKIKSRKK